VNQFGLPRGRPGPDDCRTLLRTSPLLPLVALTLTATAAAQTIVINFDFLPGPDNVLGTLDDIPIVAPTTFAAQTVQLTNEFSALGILFTPNPGLNNQNEVLLSSSFTTPPTHTLPNLFASSGTLLIEATFTVPVARVRALVGISGGADTLTIFDAGGAVLGSMQGDDVEVELTSATPIARMSVTATVGTTPAIDNLEFDISGSLGTVYCAPAVANSTGASATIAAVGSTVIASNNLRLEAASMPTSAFGFFLDSRTQGMINQPGGSQGVLCLGGSIGRFVGPGQIQNSGASGAFSLQIDLTRVPTPTGPVAVMAGDTWNFQAWYRDAVGGVATSNFTSAVSITF